LKTLDFMQLYFLLVTLYTVLQASPTPMSRVSALVPAHKLTAEDCTPEKQLGRAVMIDLLQTKMKLAPLLAKGAAYWKTNNLQDFTTALTAVDDAIRYFQTVEASLANHRASFHETFGKDYADELHSLHKDRQALEKSKATELYLKATDALSGVGKSVSDSKFGKWTAEKWTTLFPSKQAAVQDAQASSRQLQLEGHQDVLQNSKYQLDHDLCTEMNMQQQVPVHEPVLDVLSAHVAKTKDWIGDQFQSAPQPSQRHLNVSPTRGNYGALDGAHTLRKDYSDLQLEGLGDSSPLLLDPPNPSHSLPSMKRHGTIANMV